MRQQRKVQNMHGECAGNFEGRVGWARAKVRHQHESETVTNVTVTSKQRNEMMFGGKRELQNMRS